MSVSGKMLRGTVSLSGAAILARVGVFLSNIAVIRLLGKELTGQLGLIESWLSLAIMFAILGIDVAVTKYVAQFLESDRERLGATIGASVALCGALSLAAASATYGILLFGSHWSSNPVLAALSAYKGVIFWLVIGLSLKTVATSLIYGFQLFGALTKASFVVGLLSFPLSLSLVHWHGLSGALEARLVLLIVEMLFLLLAIRDMLRTAVIRVSFGNLWSESRRLLGFGFAAFIGTLVANPAQTLMTSFLASQPGGLVQVGLLTTGNRLVALANFFPTSLATTVIPILAGEWGKGNSENFKESTLATLRLSWLGTLPLAVFFLAAAPTFLFYLYGRDFVDAWPVTFVLLALSVLISLNQTGDRALAATGHIWLSTFNNVVWVLLFLPLAYFLVPAHLAMGYAAAFTTAYVLYVGLQMGCLRVLFGMSLRPVMAMALLSAIMIGAAWGAASNAAGSPSSPLHILVGALLCLLVTGIEARFFLLATERRSLIRKLTQRFQPRSKTVAA